MATFRNDIYTVLISDNFGTPILRRTLVALTPCDAIQRAKRHYNTMHTFDYIMTMSQIGTSGSDLAVRLARDPHIEQTTITVTKLG